ncbi:MAG: PAS domain S-box protein [Actinomycetes bacterium]
MSAGRRPAREGRLRTDSKAAAPRLTRMLRDHAAIMILVDPKTGRIEDANQAAADFYGYTVAKMRSMLISQINVLPDEEVARRRQEALTQARRHFVFPHRLADGQIRSVEVDSSPVTDHGRPLLLSIVHDITEREHVEAQLRQAATVFANTLEPVIITDAEGIVSQSNPAFTALTGWHPADIVGQHANALTRPRPASEPVEDLDRNPLTKSAIRTEVLVLHSDGSESPALLSVSPIPGAMGEVTGEVHVMTDITERVRTERELAQQAAVLAAINAALAVEHERHKLALSGTRVGLWDWNMQTDAEVFDQQWAQILGYELPELEPIDTHTWERLCHPEDLERSREMIDRHRRGLQPYYDIELRMKHRDGHWVWVRDRGRIVEWDEAGRPLRMVGSHEDVTASHTAAAALAAAEAKYRLVAENSSDVVLHVDAASTIRWASPSIEPVLGWDPEGILGTKVIDLDHPEDRARAQAWRAKFRPDASAPVIELRVRTAAGSHRWMSIHARPTTDNDGSITGRIVGLRDAHEQVLAREQLARSEQTFRLAMEGAPLGMAVVNLDGQFIRVNEVLCELVGRESAWMIDHFEHDVLDTDSLGDDRAVRARLLAGDCEYDLHEIQLLTAQGSTVWVQHSIALVRDEQHQPQFYVSQYQDITAARSARAQLRYQAEHDSLTGLINRAQLHERMVSILAREPKAEGTPALLFCDLDHFKNVNDTRGHADGDYTLQLVAERIKSVLRSEDEVARLGGDEFVVVLPLVRDAESAVIVAEKIRLKVSQPLPLDGDPITVTMSVGVALGNQGADAHQLLREADAALYQAKASGRNQVASFLGPSEQHR